MLIDFKDLSGFENLSCLNDLNRHGNITGLNDLNSLFGLKESKAAYTLISGWFPAIRNLSSLNDLNSLNDLSGLNGLNSLISSKKLTEYDVANNLASKCPILVSQCRMDLQKLTI